MIRRLGLTALALVAALALSGCGGAAGGDNHVDAKAIESGIAEIDGVTEVSVGSYNTGAPGRNALRTELVVDETGLAALADVLDAAIDVVAAEASGWSGYEFTVSAEDASSPTGTISLSLDKRLTAEQVPYGSLGSSLRLTPDELQQAAGA